MAHFTFKTSTYPKELAVVKFHGEERLSELFHFEIELASLRSDLAFDSLVGKPATLSLQGRAMERHVHGVVNRMELVRVYPKRTVYRAHLVPSFRMLALGRSLEIFQQKTTREIITQVLSESAIENLHHQWKLKASYEPRDFCAQYRESDLDFISRLLEEEGIGYYFDHQSSKSQMVLTDDAFGAIPGDSSTLIYKEDASMVRDQEVVHDFSLGQQLRSGAVKLRDYSFKKPGTKVEASASGKEPSLAVYDYPGEFIDSQLGRRLAAVRLQELEAEHRTGVGASDCNRLSPGHSFTLGDETRRHLREDLNGDYLLTFVRHEGTQLHVMGEEGSGEGPTYGNTFGVIPAAVKFRPPRRTPRPLARGVHTAVVVGPAGEEIYTDRYGRVKVHFNWDRAPRGAEDSCWIRVSQDWAGQDYGGMILPRVGQEVLVEFLDGDPDRPVIMGRVYNANQFLPVSLPSTKTTSIIQGSSTPGGAGLGNSITFRDEADDERLSFHADKNSVAQIEHDATAHIKGNRQTVIDNDETIEVFGSRELTVRNDSTHRTTTNLTIEAKQSMTLKVGGTSVEMTPSQISIRGAQIESSSSGTTTISGKLVTINPGAGFWSGVKGKLGSWVQTAYEYSTPGLVETLYDKLKAARERRYAEVQAKEHLRKKIEKAAGDDAPTLLAQIDQLERDGYTIRESVDEKGTFHRRSEKLIIVTRDYSPSTSLNSVAHEAGHALDLDRPYVDFGTLTKEQYVAANLKNRIDGEGAAVLNELRTADEVNSNGGTGWFHSADQNAIYTDLKAGTIDEPTAVTKLGDLYSVGNPSSAPEMTYVEHYGEFYEKHWDKHHPPAGGP
jgi:type VI secretion system secreted protein VgrG